MSTETEIQNISTGYVPRTYQAEVHIALKDKRFAVLTFHRRPLRGQ